MGSPSPADTQPSRSDIVNRLTLRLLAIGLLAAVITGLIPAIAGPVGPLGILIMFLLYGLVLWFIVDAVFAALEELLELKLDERV